MTAPTNPQNDFSPFLPSTFNVPEEQDRWKDWIGETFSQFSDVSNDKVIGNFVQDSQNFNGHKYFYDTTKKLRNGYRFLLRIVSFPNTGVLVIPLPISVNNQFAISQAWGSASLPPTTPGTGEYFSFYSEGSSKITFVMTDLDITITTTTDMTAYSGFIIVDYILDGQ